MAHAMRTLIADALNALGIEQLVLAVHDASFPGLPEEDIGRGSPYSGGGRAFLRFAAEFGFTGVQFGPQGRTSPINPSPYDGTLFAKSPLSVALGPLAHEERWQGLLSPKVLADAVGGRPPTADQRVAFAYVWQAQETALATAYATFTSGLQTKGPLAQACQAFVARHSDWLLPDSLFEALAAVHGTLDWRRWLSGDGELLDAHLFSPRSGLENRHTQRLAALRRQHAQPIEYANFCQFLVHAQHAELRGEMAALGLKLYGDLQIGVSHRDLWRFHNLFLPNYWMGAPPSRTNPSGQPWGYPVLNPESYIGGLTPAQSSEPPGLRFVRARFTKMLDEFDGLRIDHPHGHVCPWVYRAEDPDPLHAVQHGARLFASPDLPDHPDLARFALVTRADLAPNPNHPRYKDDWVRTLNAEQVARHATVFDVLVDLVRARGGPTSNIACEVLSTCPSPLAAVLSRHDLGRFRVTQKADPKNPEDPYRTAKAHPSDWVMLGTHDTKPAGLVFAEWQGTQRGSEWAAYLADRLEPDPARRPNYASRLSQDPIQFQRAMAADLFVGPARHVSIFFADLLGIQEIYNRPGEVHPENWTLRIPPDYAQIYRERRAAGKAFDLPGSLALALRAQRSVLGPQESALVLALEKAS